MKRRADSGLGFDPDAAAVAFDDAFARGQSDPAARGLALVRHALKGFKDGIEVSSSNADAVVGDTDAGNPGSESGAEEI